MSYFATKIKIWFKIGQNLYTILIVCYGCNNMKNFYRTLKIPIKFKNRENESTVITSSKLRDVGFNFLKEKNLLEFDSFKKGNGKKPSVSLYSARHSISSIRNSGKLKKEFQKYVSKQLNFTPNSEAVKMGANIWFNGMVQFFDGHNKYIKTKKVGKSVYFDLCGNIKFRQKGDKTLLYIPGSASDKGFWIEAMCKKCTYSNQIEGKNIVWAQIRLKNKEWTVHLKYKDPVPKVKSPRETLGIDITPTKITTDRGNVLNFGHLAENKKKTVVKTRSLLSTFNKNGGKRDSRKYNKILKKFKNKIKREENKSLENEKGFLRQCSKYNNVVVEDKRKANKKATSMGFSNRPITEHNIRQAYIFLDAIEHYKGLAKNLNIENWRKQKKDDQILEEIKNDEVLNEGLTVDSTDKEVKAYQEVSDHLEYQKGIVADRKRILKIGRKKENDALDENIDKLMEDDNFYLGACSSVTITPRLIKLAKIVQKERSLHALAGKNIETVYDITENRLGNGKFLNKLKRRSNVIQVKIDDVLPYYSVDKITEWNGLNPVKKAKTLKKTYKKSREKSSASFGDTLVVKPKCPAATPSTNDRDCGRAVRPFRESLRP